MRETFCKTELYQVDHTKFGGVIYASDFNTDYTKGNIASRIESDKRFDEQCRKNLLSKQIYGGNKK